MLLEQERDLRAFYTNLMKPPKIQSVAEWAEENVIIPPGRESHSGAMDFHRAPYAREPLECYADDLVRELVLVFGTQCLKTTIMRCGAMYRIVNNPLPCMWVLPNEKNLAVPFSKNRWMPLLEACAATARLIPRSSRGMRDKSNFSILEQTFTHGMPLNFVGSNSPANLSSRPAGLLQMDETDKFAQETDFEPGALKNAEERAKNFPFHLIVKSSTPTVATHGIWAEYLLTDQRKFEVPCARCGERIVLRFRVKTEAHGDCGLRWYVEHPDEVKKDGRWDFEAVAQAAHYKCQLCGGRNENSERIGMVQAGKWRAYNPEAKGGRRGYHLSSMYSLISNECTYPAVAVAWCEGSGSMSARHGFINSTLAEPWNLQAAFDEQTVRTSAYEIRTATGEDRVRIMTIDFQLNHFWVVIREWAPMSDERPMGESWLLVADRVDTEAELMDLQAAYQVDGNNVFLDIAGRQNAAGQIIARHGWIGYHGSDRKCYPHNLGHGQRVERVYSEVNTRDAHHGTKMQNRSPDNFFPFLYWCKDPTRDHVNALKAQEPTLWHIHANAHSQYQRHMNAHVRLERTNAKTGKTEAYYRELYPDDHLWDCECMNANRAVMLGLCPLMDIRGESEQGELPMAR